MRHIPRTPRLASAFVLIVIAAGATAQSMSDASKATCQIIGANAREPVGDRDGHYLTVVQYSCRNDGGPADGTITTGTVLWESDKMASALVAGTGVLRKNGALAVFRDSEGTQSLNMADGKITGFSGAAKGTYTMATGSMSTLAGKSFNSTFRSISPTLFVIDTNMN